MEAINSALGSRSFAEHARKATDWWFIVNFRLTTDAAPPSFTGDCAQIWPEGMTAGAATDRPANMSVLMLSMTTI